MALPTRRIARPLVSSLIVCQHGMPPVYGLSVSSRAGLQAVAGTAMVIQERTHAVRAYTPSFASKPTARYGTSFTPSSKNTVERERCVRSGSSGA